MSETFTATPPGMLQRIARGDKAAMRELLSQYGPLVWSLARSFTRSSADAEDAAQDVFVHLWKKAAQYDPAHGLEVQFVSVLARRRLIDWIRAHTNPTELVGYATRQSPAAAAAPANLDEEAALAWNVLGNLSPDHQSAVTLSVVHGLTHEQISRHLQIPLGTVKTNLYRGLAALRSEVARHHTQSQASRDRLRPLAASGRGHSS